MEYSEQKRSNLLFVGIMWLAFCGYVLLRSVPYQQPLKYSVTDNFYTYSVCYIVFIISILTVGCIARDGRLLRAYACCALIVLLLLMCREHELEQPLLGKVRDLAVSFFVMPYWGWVRVLEENTEQWIAAWCALSGGIAFFASRAK